MMGVSGRIQPSTWQRCTRCEGVKRAGVCNCKRSRLSGQNDIVFVEQEVLWQGLQSGLAKSTLRRVRWSTSIDHSILHVTVPLAMVAPSQPSVPRVKSVVWRLMLPARLLLRAKLLRLIGTRHDEAMRVDPSLTVSGALSKIGENFYEPTMEKVEMTPEEFSAAVVNAPKLFWDFQEILGKDAGSAEVVSSAGLLDCLCNTDGSLLEGDNRKTAGLILRHRQDMATVPVELCCGDEVVYDALRSVSKFNGTIGRLDKASAACKVSVRPDHYWRVYEERRNVPSQASVRYDEWRQKTPEWDDGARSAHDAVHVKYPDAAGMLNADITVAEVAAMLAKMKDVGASLDNVPPVVMQAHAGHSECAVIRL